MKNIPFHPILVFFPYKIFQHIGYRAGIGALRVCFSCCILIIDRVR